MEDVAQTGVTALSHTYLHSKTDDLKQTFDEEGQKLLDRFDDEPDAAVNKGGFWSVDTLWTGLVLLAAAGTVCANIFAIILDGSRLSIAAGSFGSAVAVKVAVGELRIEDLDSEYPLPPTGDVCLENYRYAANFFLFSTTASLISFACRAKCFEVRSSQIFK